MKVLSESPKLTPAEAAKARREAEKAAALRANLARRKAQARAQTTAPEGEKDPPCR
jgi:hypothetical protein